MYRVAVVDDDEKSSAQTVKLLERFQAENNVEFSADVFKNAVVFIDGYKSDYDIVFMDIAMPYMDGMTAAAKLREIDGNVLLIFVTNMAQFAVRGYDVDAFGFLIKPVTYESMALKLLKAVERLKRSESDTVVIGSKTGFRKVKISDVKYVEIRGHTLIWHTVDGDYKSTGTLTKVQQQLDGTFAFCNQCYLINLRYCDALDGAEVCVGGESFDLPRTQDMNNGGISGKHYLQLDKNEYDLLDMVTNRFDKVIVLLNTLTPMQLDFLYEYNNTQTDKRIDAVLWIGGPGITGAKAIGSLLNGEVSPSGKTVDIYPRDFRLDPTWQNFGDGSQTTEDGSPATAFREGSNDIAGYNMVMYEEGVYLGYRYYETRDYEERLLDASSDWYENNVIFPFGYGLSYTTFDQKIADVKGGLGDGKKLEITVEVENTGGANGMAGKDVVQLYVSKPYYRGGIEKSYVELIDFAKTDLLTVSGPSSSQRITFTVDPYDLASYDYNDANGNGFPGYELEHGEYTFFISSDSHVAKNAYDSTSVTLDNDRKFEFGVDGKTKVENRFTVENSYDDIQYRLSDVTIVTENGEVTRKGMSRMNFQSTFASAPTGNERRFMEEEKDGYTEQSKIESFEHNNTAISSKAQKYTMGDRSSELLLRDLLNDNGEVDYEDERWAELLNKLTFNEMLDLVNTGAFMTVSIESIKKNLTNDSDGPVGFVNFMPGAVSDIFAGNATFACEIVIGSTWNKDLAYRMGKSVGESGLWGDQSGNNNLPYSGWYAPAVNLHRSPFSGRNYEYYSEDPILSGRMAVGVINGARQKGVYTDLKHFALNDQETNRSNVSTFVTEQAFRELYLKPFEIAVKGNSNVVHSATAVNDEIDTYRGTTGVMSSFNRVGNKWAGGDYRLLTEVLRNEWGFRGLVISDYKTKNDVMDSRQMLYAGNDLILTSTGDCVWRDASADSAEDITVLREASKNILYTVANSNSIQIDIVGYKTEWWISLIIALDIVIPILLAVWGFFAVSKALGKGKNYKEVFVNTFMGRGRKKPNQESSDGAEDADGAQPGKDDK